MNRGSKSGFTLIELLVVIAIIAVLASMLVPAVQSALVRGKVAYCASNLHQMGIATYEYANDHKGVVPPLQDNGNRVLGNIHDTRKFAQQGATYSQGILYGEGYAENGKMYYCPTQTEFFLSWPAYSNPTFPTGPMGNGAYSSGFVRSGYSYNPMIPVIKAGARVRPAGEPKQLIHVLNEVAYPLTTILAADTFEPPYLASRHPGSAWNVGMADGHVEEIKSPSALAMQLRREKDFNPGNNWGLYVQFMQELINSR